MKIELYDVYVDPKDRIREPENLILAVKERIPSLLRFGQLQHILVETLPEPIEGKHYKLIDGQVRLVSLMQISLMWSQYKEEAEAAGIEKGFVNASTRASIDPIHAKMLEFHTNEDSAKFTYQEKCTYVRSIHDLLVAKHEGKWDPARTAEYIGWSRANVYTHLQLTDPNDPAAQDKRVKEATTLVAAKKQYNIAKARSEKLARAKAATKVVEKPVVRIESGEAPIVVAPVTPRDPYTLAQATVYHGDCRDWIKMIPDNSLDWFHWDPPYGGKEGEGGAFSAHAPIQTDHNYALQLMLDMLAEIHRVLTDGSWIAMWYTPVHYHWLRLALQGHRFNKDGYCNYCDKHLWIDYLWLSQNYSCRPSPYRFWTNPYPNIWYKANRVADGSEIQRYFIKQTETFLMAGKNVDKMPVLMAQRPNVFAFDSFPQHSMERRHVHHKPAPLLKAIIETISVSGNIGGDAGGGSGSIIEAAYDSGRRIVVAELDDQYYETCLTIATEKLKARNYRLEQLAPWAA